MRERVRVQSSRVSYQRPVVTQSSLSSFAWRLSRVFPRSRPQPEGETDQREVADKFSLATCNKATRPALSLVSASYSCTNYFSSFRFRESTLGSLVFLFGIETLAPTLLGAKLASNCPWKSHFHRGASALQGRKKESHDARTNLRASYVVCSSDTSRTRGFTNLCR